jgi:uncharacterized protein (TIGR03083 family)
MSEPAAVDWQQARMALDAAATQVAELLRSGIDPKAPALGEWDVAELATHLSHAFDVVPALARRERSSPIGELWELSDQTRAWVVDDPERDLAALATRIETRAATFLDVTRAGGGGDPCPWLIEGSSVSLATHTCHLLNESVLHGYDIAMATGRPWPIDRTAAALIFEGFLLDVFRVVDPRALVLQDKAAGVRACYDIRLRGAGRFFLVFDEGRMTVEAPSERKVDCHLSADPAAFLLVAWGRISQWHAIPRGQLLAWGRRPWMGLRMRGFLQNP